jgi:hypothetical protein
MEPALSCLALSTTDAARLRSLRRYPSDLFVWPERPCYYNVITAFVKLFSGCKATDLPSAD